MQNMLVAMSPVKWMVTLTLHWPKRVVSPHHEGGSVSKVDEDPRKHTFSPYLGMRGATGVDLKLSS